MFVPDGVETIVRHLENTQWWPSDVLARHQYEQLSPLANHAYQCVRWYRACDGLRQIVEKGIDGTTWRLLPLLTRADIQDAGDLLHAQSVPTSHGAVGRTWTGGSTGAPVMALNTELTRRFWIANTLREHAWQKRDLAGRMAVIRYLSEGGAEPPDGATLNHWSAGTAAHITTGPCAVLNINSTTSQQARWLEQVQPRYLQTYPSVASTLAEHCLAHDIRIQHLRQVCTFGEVVDHKVRDACRLAWGAEVVDSYSSNEVGHIAIECSEHRYHVQAEHLLVEVLDECGQQCQPGQTGRVVITDLFNYAMPLLRYDIGDYAEVGGACPCGRNLPTLSRILGRQRNMFVRPNGERFWPALPFQSANAIAAQLPVRQFQVIQTGLHEIELKLVATRSLTTEEERAVRALVQGAVGGEFSTRLTYVDRIPRSATGKYEDFRCDLADG